MAKKQPEHLSKRMKARAAQRRKKRLTQMIIAAIVLLVVAGGAWALLTNDTTPVAQGDLPLEISVDEAYQKYEAGAFLLDVRTPEEWDDFHIPGTTLIPLDELPGRVSEVPADQEVVVVCRSGNRSQSGRDILLNAGFETVTSMDGGVSTWQAAGYPIE